MLEQTRAAGFRTFTERPLIEFVQQLGNGFIEVAEMEESLVPKRRYNPALCDLYSGLGLGFDAGYVRACRHDCQPVVLRHLAIGRV